MKIEDITAELTDPAHLNRTHGSDPTYDAGCRGPLCSKAHADKKFSRSIRQKGWHLRRRPRNPYDKVLYDFIVLHRIQRGLKPEPPAYITGARR